jgi:hypothetical protein
MPVEVWASAFQVILMYPNLIMADLKHGVAGGMAGIAVDAVFYPL